MDLVRDTGKLVADRVNFALQSREPWQIVVITTTTVLSGVWLYEFFSQEEGIVSRSKKHFFKMARKLPFVKAQITEELNKRAKEFEDSAIKQSEGLSYITHMPEMGFSDQEILSLVDSHLQLGHYKWKEGRVSGAVYYFDPALVSLTQTVYGRASYTNPLHADIFPGVCKMEAEVVRMTANLFHGGPESCGTMTTGGTESLIMACKAYRDYAREEKGISQPNIVMPVTAHSGFDKAAQYLKLHVKTVPLDRSTMAVNIQKMEAAITSNTIMLVGSAPNYPYGTMDDIEAIARLGMKYNIPVHVDACLGGFVIIFMKRAGYPLPPFDFRVKGVTSISADTHKYGFAPKGSSVILYSEKKYRRHQFTVTTDWPGGVYGSPSVNGSRAGGVIAATWATLVRFGLDGYTEATKRIVDTAKYIERGLRTMEGIYVYGQPATSVIAFGSHVFDIYRLSDALSKLGWNLNNLQFPPGVHICVTFMHTREGVADKFLQDMREQLVEILKDPGRPVEGKMAIYGVAQSLPDRSLVGDFTRLWLDAMYYTPPEERKNGSLEGK
ncbi:sphingosine-1-phosphate lyase [Phlebotomus argentipes]|uniref:sphingosine-1-phosphate lyase n=1 Tax=Phlebotomus argentipes TaxID=94469 RepID=UPI002892EBCD|nr:sphingosine-1-phosphate lyase [Phlebotomus argentipes]